MYSDSPTHNSVVSTNKPSVIRRYNQLNIHNPPSHRHSADLHSSPASASSSPLSITYSSSVNPYAFSISNNNPSRYITRSFFPQIMKQSNSNTPLNVVLETGGRTLSTPCCGCCPQHRVAQRTPPNATTAGMRMEWRRMAHNSEPRLCTARSSGRPAVLAPHQPVDLLQPALLPPDRRQIAVCWACATHGLLCLLYTSDAADES